MRRRGYFVFVCILALMLVGCGSKDKVKEINNNVETLEEKSDNQVNEEGEDSDTVVENTENNETEPIVEENVETVQEPDKTANDSNTGTSTKPSSGSTTKPSTGSTGNSGSTNSGSTGNTQNNNSGTTTQPSTPVHEHKWTEVVEEEIHYYAWRTICNVCNADITDLGSEGIINHTFECGGASYANYYKEVDFVTENVVKTPVVTGYKCECGAEK